RQRGASQCGQRQGRIGFRKSRTAVYVQQFPPHRTVACQAICHRRPGRSGQDSSHSATTGGGSGALASGTGGSANGIGDSTAGTGESRGATKPCAAGSVAKQRIDARTPYGTTRV